VGHWDTTTVPPAAHFRRYRLQVASLKAGQDKSEVLVLPASAVTEISYGQDVHRRVGAAIGLAVISFGMVD